MLNIHFLSNLNIFNCVRAGFLLGMLLKKDRILKITGLHLETKPHIVSLHRRSQKKYKIQQLWSTNSDEVHQIMVVCYQQKTIKPTWRVGDFLLAPSCVSWSIFSYSSLKLNQQSKTPPKRYYCIVYQLYLLFRSHGSWANLYSNMLLNSQR